MGAEEDSSTFVGRMKVNVKPATKRKALKRTGSTNAQNGTRSDVRKPPRRSGSGKGVL